MSTSRQIGRNSRIKLAVVLLVPALLLGGCSRDANLAEKVAAADAAALRAEQAAQRAEHAAGEVAKAQPATVIEAEAEPDPNDDQPEQANANEAPAPAPAPEPTIEG